MGFLGACVRLRPGFFALLGNFEDIAEPDDAVDPTIVESEEAGDDGGGLVLSLHSKKISSVDSSTTSSPTSLSLSSPWSSGKL